MEKENKVQHRREFGIGKPRFVDAGVAIGTAAILAVCGGHSQYTDGSRTASPFTQTIDCSTVNGEKDVMVDPNIRAVHIQADARRGAVVSALGMDVAISHLRFDLNGNNVNSEIAIGLQN